MQFDAEAGRVKSRIVGHSSKRELYNEGMRYFMQKSNELKQFQRRLDSSMHQLKSLENDQSQQEQPSTNAEMAETFFAHPSQHRLDLTKLLQQKHNKIKLKSLPSEQSKLSHAVSHRSSRQPTMEWSSKSELKLNLPNLLSKAKKSKLPTNASRNMKLSLESKEDSRQELDHTYEKIKQQRRKFEQQRHILVLGKVLGENHRKELRSLWVLKRNNRANKYAKI